MSEPTEDTGRRCPRCDCPDGHTQCDHCKVCPHADPPGVACAVLHTDGQGNVIPCPGYPHAAGISEGPDRHPSLTAKLSAGCTEERLRAAEIRAAVAEHEAEAYRNQVQALIRSIQRERGVPEEELRECYMVVVHHERDLSEQRVREIIRDEIAQAARAARRRR